MIKAFHEMFPEIGKSETRSVILQSRDPQWQGQGSSLQAGEYAFFEMYCSDPDCDCRRVVLQVASEHGPEALAWIGWSWESRAYFRNRGLTEEEIDVAKGPALEEISPRTEQAEELIGLASESLLRDRRYVKQLKRHYAMFKQKIGEQAAMLRKRKKKALKQRRKRRR